MTGVNIVTVGVDQRTTNWVTRRRPVRSAEAMGGAPVERPRFARFAAAMAAARAADAPHLAAVRDVLADDIPHGLAHDIPAAGRNSPPPRAAAWQALRVPGHPLARWFGIGSCVLALGLLLVAVPMQPIGADGPWFEWQQEPEPGVAAPQVEKGLPVAPEPAAGRADLPAGSMPVADESSGAASEPDLAVPAVAVVAPAPAPEKPVAGRSVPVPALKPRLTRR